MQNAGKKSVMSLLFPLIWEALFVASYLVVALRDDRRHFALTLYFMLVFYLGIIVVYRKHLLPSESFHGFTSLKSFFLPVICTAAGVAFMMAVSNCFGPVLFPGSFKILLPLAYTSDIPGTILFAVTVMFIKPVAAELLFRGAWIRFDSKALMILTAAAGLILEALTCGITPQGILETALIAVPFAVAYCLTKNLYVTIFVHIIYSLIVNLPDVIYDIVRLVLS